MDDEPIGQRMCAREGCGKVFSYTRRSAASRMYCSDECARSGSVKRRQDALALLTYMEKYTPLALKKIMQQLKRA